MSVAFGRRRTRGLISSLALVSGMVGACGPNEVMRPVGDVDAAPADGAVVSDTSSADTPGFDGAALSDVAPADGADTSPAEVGCLSEGERAHEVQADRFVTSQDEFAAFSFNSNPPSSGPHCMDPGQYSAYTAQPLPRCNYLENLARGGVVVAYKCAQGCEALVRDIGRSLVGAMDPDCPALRVVITSDPALDVPVAAAAWGYTWKAACLDMTAMTSLRQFINDHLGSKGKAPRRAPVMCR